MIKINFKKTFLVSIKLYVYIIKKESSKNHMEKE